MNDITKRISNLGIVPVIKLDDAADAAPLAKALLKGGIGCAEVTFRTDAAEQAIKNIVKEVPDMLAGAGTVLTVDQAKRAIGAGAKFLVSPGFNEKVVRYAIEQGVPIVPGCSNPSDVERALELGLTDIKFFPAEQAGGLAMIKALCGPYTTVRFMPTGGINPDNFLEYLASDKIIAVGGSWMVKADLIKEKKFDKITEMCEEAVRKMLGFELLHIGINCESGDEAALCRAARLCGEGRRQVGLRGQGIRADEGSRLRQARPHRHRRQFRRPRVCVSRFEGLCFQRGHRRLRREGQDEDVLSQGRILRLCRPFYQ